MSLEFRHGFVLDGLDLLLVVGKLERGQLLHLRGETGKKRRKGCHKLGWNVLKRWTHSSRSDNWMSERANLYFNLVLSTSCRGERSPLLDGWMHGIVGGGTHSKLISLFNLVCPSPEMKKIKI